MIRRLPIVAVVVGLIAMVMAPGLAAPVFAAARPRATVFPLNRTPGENNLVLVVKVGRLSKGAPPKAAVDVIRANPPDLFNYPTDRFYLKVTDSAAFDLHGTLGSPVTVYDRDGLRIVVTPVVEGSVARLKLTISGQGLPIGQLSRPGFPSEMLIPYGQFQVNSWDHLYNSIIDVSSPSHPNRGLGLIAAWGKDAAAQAAGFRAAANRTWYGPDIGDDVAPGLDCTPRPFEVSQAAGRAYTAAGAVHVRVKRDRSGFERIDGEALPSTLAGLKPARLSPNGYCQEPTVPPPPPPTSIGLPPPIDSSVLAPR